METRGTHEVVATEYFGRLDGQVGIYEIFKCYKSSII